MKSKQVVPSINLTPEGTHPPSGAERKLKSERVQLELQLPERVQRKFREATGYERVLLVMALPGLDTGRALRSMRLFAEHIAPVMVPA